MSLKKSLSRIPLHLLEHAYYLNCLEIEKIEYLQTAVVVKAIDSTTGAKVLDVSFHPAEGGVVLSSAGCDSFFVSEDDGFYAFCNAVGRSAFLNAEIGAA